MEEATTKPEAETGAAVLGNEIPRLVELQHSTLSGVSAVMKRLEKVTLAHLTGATIPITTLAPEPFDLLKDIPAIVRPVDDGFTATFFDANISTSGDTREEAVWNLKSLIVDIFEDLEAEPVGKLGPEPSRQLEILKTFIRRRA